MQYILVMRDTKFWLVGPFVSQQDANIYGTDYLAPGGEDDPRWQTIDLPNTLHGHVGAKIYAPDVARDINETNALTNYIA